VRLEQVALVKLGACADPAQAHALAARVALTPGVALLGGFVHSSQWDEAALGHLLQAAQDAGLGVDLHVDEELNAQARGLATIARLLRERGFEQRAVCGHVCALAAMPEADALRVLDDVARAPITLVSLPITNLLLQDACVGRTPRLRGITLVKEARSRGIPVLLASDNVQDPFCPVGSFDPLEAFAAATLAAQLDNPFDTWSDAICRADWLRPGHHASASLIGQPADLVVFADADATGWPSRATRRVVLRGGVAREPAPAAWQVAPAASLAL
jgi:cytosine deaminase